MKGFLDKPFDHDIEYKPENEPYTVKGMYGKLYDRYDWQFIQYNRYEWSMQPASNYTGIKQPNTKFAGTHRCGFYFTDGRGLIWSILHRNGVWQVTDHVRLRKTGTQCRLYTNGHTDCTPQAKWLSTAVSGSAKDMGSISHCTYVHDHKRNTWVLLCSDYYKTAHLFMMDYHENWKFVSQCDSKVGLENLVLFCTRPGAVGFDWYGGGREYDIATGKWMDAPSFLKKPTNYSILNRIFVKGSLVGQRLGNLNMQKIINFNEALLYVRVLNFSRTCHSPLEQWSDRAISEDGIHMPHQILCQILCYIYCHRMRSSAIHHFGALAMQLVDLYLCSLRGLLLLPADDVIADKKAIRCDMVGLVDIGVSLWAGNWLAQQVRIDKRQEFLDDWRIAPVLTRFLMAQQVRQGINEGHAGKVECNYRKDIWM